MSSALSTPSGAAQPAGPTRPDVLLVTLDTTRADALGCYGGANARTPNLDQLAARGLRFASAWSPVPLTLPAHASLFTGLAPAEHGLRDNGWGRLPSHLPVLSESLKAAGYRTAAFPASQVLAARFGLDRGFDFYDDRLTAERIGQYGYPERTAREGVDAALAWLAKEDSRRPVFLWIHFYDPHSPYLALESRVDASDRERYAAEIAEVDRQLGRLLSSWRTAHAPLVAVVGDHGEAFGEHLEQGHGLFLYRTTLEVPLLLAGPGLPAGKVVPTPVATQRLAATLCHVLGLHCGLAGAPLPLAKPDKAPEPIFHETFYPASAFGWHSLSAVTLGNQRAIAAPHPERFDLAVDPGELQNLAKAKGADGRALEKLLLDHLKSLPPAPPSTPPLPPDAAAALRSLGYLSGQSGRAGSLDPKDGVTLLAELDAANRLALHGALPEALSRMRSLAARSPESVPFLTRLAALERQAGHPDAALASLERALKRNPQLDFLYLEQGEMLLEVGRQEEGVRALRAALALNPQSATAWFRLAEIEARAGRGREEEDLLLQALEAGTQSALIFTRLAEIHLARGELQDADQYLERSTALLPEWPTSWRIWAQVARRQGRPDLAEERERHTHP
ncbi:MAG: sulfatase-like hydrolase/transferase [Thermoanaerobaculia bacterium]